MSDRPAHLHLAPVVAVSDLGRARAFYGDQLGLDGSASPGGGWTLAGDHGTVLNLLADVPDAGSASWPVAQDGLEVTWMRDPDGNVPTVFSS